MRDIGLIYDGSKWAVFYPEGVHSAPETNRLIAAGFKLARDTRGGKELTDEVLNDPR